MALWLDVPVAPTDSFYRKLFEAVWRILGDRARGIASERLPALRRCYTVSPDSSTFLSENVPGVRLLDEFRPGELLEEILSETVSGELGRRFWGSLVVSVVERGDVAGLEAMKRSIEALRAVDVTPWLDALALDVLVALAEDVGEDILGDSLQLVAERLDVDEDGVLRVSPLALEFAGYCFEMILLGYVVAYRKPEEIEVVSCDVFAVEDVRRDIERRISEVKSGDLELAAEVIEEVLAPYLRVVTDVRGYLEEARSMDPSIALEVDGFSVSIAPKELDPEWDRHVQEAIEKLTGSGGKARRVFN
ncbi:hypothetical protein [Methanopyrus kandleri]|uniref:Uncharacterized protein specific for M.kandleri, MK-7 family n=2 Tax=Methanopyrus kandleri TaxID=2320 RepID=Q8TXN6_METKA|nr:hypothetical protein [Methanopyrus kandleri]AAM01841.1 Uncharacterized protein specific for M.kandleri, MK-7 family [Methanopyrus kandleri AV19]HII70150.1 hypothetical protein [Methanopyrus kandleri]